jgi:hypothetical protein
MKTAISQRLDELIVVAKRLRKVIDSEKPGATLVAMQLCWAAVAIDADCGQLERHAELLQIRHGDLRP